MISKAEKTRTYIIEKSAPIFNKKGFAGTSLNDLIDATGLTKGAIYGNFANKDEVALAVYDYNVSRVMNALNARITGQENAADKLFAITEFYRSNYKLTITNGGCPILNTAIDADDCHPLLRQKAMNSIKSWRKTIELIIKKGIEQGEIKDNVNAAEYAVIFISLIEGGLMMSNIADDRSLLFTCLTQIEKMIKKKLIA
ncbi:MAG: TetR/AcrR family transcriptional regulator [Bacteroidetes bacterium]|nr:TetR/AcrR family transcriptional regulator [Bacteroidota bacterium]